MGTRPGTKLAYLSVRGLIGSDVEPPARSGLNTTKYIPKSQLTTWLVGGFLPSKLGGRGFKPRPTPLHA